MVPDHYFTSAPGSEARHRPLRVTLHDSEYTLTTAGGIFSPDHIDTGTRVLLDHVPAPPPTGHLLDVGSGWGPIALTMALMSPDAQVWAVDVNDRALELLRRNAEAVGASNIRAVTPGDVPADVAFSAIWSNPPIRVGKAALHGLLAHWIPRLEIGADAWLVVQRNLGSDSLHRWLQEELGEQFATARAATKKGFRVLNVHHGGPTGADVSAAAQPHR